MVPIVITEYGTSRVAAFNSGRTGEAKVETDGSWSWTVRPIGGGVGFIGSEPTRAAAVDAMLYQLQA